MHLEPLGANGSTHATYPGKLRVYGIGAGYQKFFWRGLFATGYVTPFLTNYYVNGSEKIRNGFQLHLRAVLGYRFELFRHRLFLEPSVEFTHWPVNTNMPLSFKTVENKYPDYSLFSPNLYFGFRF